MRNWKNIIKHLQNRLIFFVFIAVAVAITCQSCLFIISEKDFNSALNKHEISYNPLSNDQEKNCVLTLRALASTELAYQNQNRNRDFGLWSSLTRNNYIPPGQTRANIIDDYSICVFNVRASALINGMSLDNSAFTIIAIPRSQKYGLRTFGIDKSQTPRVWIGGSISPRDFVSMSMNSDLWWKPMR